MLKEELPNTVLIFNDAIFENHKSDYHQLDNRLYFE